MARIKNLPKMIELIETWLQTDIEFGMIEISQKTINEQKKLHKIPILKK